MNWQALLDPKIQSFIAAHAQDDVKALALKKPLEPDWPYPLILDQIKARQKAAKKMPDWLGHSGIIFPPADLIEQASSNACALYKTSIAGGESFVDLTGGSGMDSFALLTRFKKGIAVEHNAQAAQVLAHNAAVLGFEERLSVEAMEAEDFIKTMPHVDLVYLDPQRRDEGRKGKFDLSACTPNITALLPILRNKCAAILLKTSPVLDIHKTISDLEYVREVHVVQYQGDCKELLFLLDCAHKTDPAKIRIKAVEMNESGAELNSLEFTPAEEKQTTIHYNAPMAYIYEPGPAFQKVGGYNVIGLRYGIAKLHPNTNLYTGDTVIEDFPGRKFKLEGECAVSKKELKAILPEMKANLTVRNFPSSPEDLRKKLSLKEGGLYTIFACELYNGRKALLKCQKI